MQNVIFTKGMQGSGKSTWAKQYCQDHPEYVRISRDDLRHMRGRYWMPRHEDLITDWEYSLVADALVKGYHLVIDEMNLNEDNLEKLKSFIKSIKTNVKFEIKDFTDVPLEVCIERDMKRPNSIGEKVLRSTYNKYLANNRKIIQNCNLPSAIIVDLDGTLCLFGDKNPYDRDFINDEVNIYVANIIDNYKSHVLLLSGRSDRFQAETKEWLDKNEIKYTALHMRTEDEEKTGIKDTVVKERLFNTYVKDKYYVDFVIDDRPSIVEYWRSLGLFVFEVNQRGEYF